MAEYGSGIFYGRSNGLQSSHSFSQLGLLSLPSELDIGPPITSYSKFDGDTSKDIVLLAEFSEIEGPIPLLTIPQNNNNHDLDLNEFVVQLMSTDYQNMGSSDFQIHKDTCLLQEDAEKGYYTYVHYFTLYDVQARGFVRPMCLAYISRESQKLKKYFKTIQKEFHKTTEYLRVCNLRFFSEEMESRIEDLHFTKERFIQSQKYFPTDEVKTSPAKSEEIPRETNRINPKLKRTRTISLDNGYVTSLPQVWHESNIVEDKINHDVNGENEKGLNWSKFASSAHAQSTYSAANPPTKLQTTPEDSSGMSLSPGERRERFLSSSLPHGSAQNNDSDTLPVRKSLSPEAMKLPVSQLRPHGYALTSSPPLNDQTAKELSKELIFQELSNSSTSSASTLKSIRESMGKPAKDAFQSPSLVREQNGDDVSVLQHTSLEALAMQLLDCQYIMESIKTYLIKDGAKTTKELDQFLDDLRNPPQSPLRVAMETLGLLHRDRKEAKKSPQKMPSLFVISIMRRTFRHLRPVRSLCGIGYIACIAKLLDTFERFSKPTLTLLFEDLDRQMYENPFSSLFIGNMPIIRVEKRNSGTGGNVPRVRKFSLNDARWNEDLVHLLFLDTPHSATPESDYADARENLDGEIAVADDCLEVFAPASPLTDAFQGDNGQDRNEDQLANYKSNSVTIRDFSLPATPLRSTSSESSWSSSTPRDLCLLDGMENETEEEGEEEEVASEVKDGSAIKLVQHDVTHRMTMAKVYRMSAVIQQFSGVSQCIVHSILSGKTMIVAGPEYLRSVVVLYIKTLSSILPVKPNELLPVLKWHTGTITPHHLKLYKIIGTCIPERLHVQDLMSIATLNQVTVLNIETGHISGVAYSGTLLYKADQLSRRNFHSDMSLQTALQAILISLGMKVFLHYHLLKTTTRTSNEILRGIGVSRGDWLMIQYLSKMLEEQLLDGSLLM